MTADRPVEHLLTAAARLSGCLDPAALATALETAGAQGGRWLDTVLDAGCLADETGFYRALADAELFVLLEAEAVGAQMTPRVFDLSGGRSTY